MLEMIFRREFYTLMTVMSCSCRLASLFQDYFPGGISGQDGSQLNIGNECQVCDFRTRVKQTLCSFSASYVNAEDWNI